MESLTFCQANRTRVGVRIVRRDTTGPDMESLTNCQANRTTVGVRTMRRDSWTCHEITHMLSSKQDTVGVRTVRRDTAEPGMSLLTCCQANRTRVEVRTP